MNRLSHIDNKLIGGEFEIISLMLISLHYPMKLDSLALQCFLMLMDA